MSAGRVVTRDRFVARANGVLVEGHEKCVLAYLMSGRDACHKFLHRVSAGIFSVPHHRIIINAIHDVYDERDEINHITVSNRLNEKGKLAECGGNSGIIDIAISTTSADIAESALECILDDFRERESARIGKELCEGKITATLARSKLDEIYKRVKTGGLTIRSPREILELPRDEHSNWLGDRLLAVAGVLVIAGVAGVGKTRLLLQLLVALILGRSWCGLETRAPGKRCLMVQTENSNHRLQTDLQAVKKWAPQEWALVEEKLRIHTVETDEDALLYLSDPQNALRLESMIRDVNPDILAFDPLRDFAHGDLNSDADMSATVRELARVGRAGNPSRGVIVLHHALTGRAGVAKAFGLERTGFARNSKVLLGWTRGLINVVPGAEDSNDQLVLTCGKNSNGREFAPIAVRLNSDMIYEVDDEFDVENWRQEISAAVKPGGVKPQILCRLLVKDREYDKKDIVALVREETGLGKTRAYQLVEQAQARRILKFNKTIKVYALM